MSSFTTPLVLQARDDGRTFQLKQRFIYDIGELGGKDKIEVPAEFVTDFASVPQIFWNIFPPWGRYGKAAVLHDYLYQKQSYSRALSDSIFLEAMGVLGVSWISRVTIYLGVRSGGWLAWRQNKKKLIKKSAGGLKS